MHYSIGILPNLLQLSVYFRWNHIGRDISSCPVWMQAADFPDDDLSRTRRKRFFTDDVDVVFGNQIYSRYLTNTFVVCVCIISPSLEVYYTFTADHFHPDDNKTFAVVQRPLH